MFFNAYRSWGMCCVSVADKIVYSGSCNILLLTILDHLKTSYVRTITAVPAFHSSPALSLQFFLLLSSWYPYSYPLGLSCGEECLTHVLIVRIVRSELFASIFDQQRLLMIEKTWSTRIHTSLTGDINREEILCFDREQISRHSNHARVIIFCNTTIKSRYIYIIYIVNVVMIFYVYKNR